jgi:hypothetical protein
VRVQPIAMVDADGAAALRTAADKHVLPRLRLTVRRMSRTGVDEGAPRPYTTTWLS